MADPSELALLQSSGIAGYPPYERTDRTNAAREDRRALHRPTTTTE
jgi:hypothetical protein